MSRDENGQEVFLGSVGKCMPVVLVQGRTAHVSRCFDGLNAVGVLGRMFEKTELSAEFAEVFDGGISECAEFPVRSGGDPGENAGAWV